MGELLASATDDGKSYIWLQICVLTLCGKSRWDLMRFVWRGKVRARVEDVDFALGTTIDPEITAASRRLQVSSAARQPQRFSIPKRSN